tara:strand:- start:114 stop:281 length:168 start_codon:yes stop_codon:yes gene_type:complete
MVIYSLECGQCEHRTESLSTTEERPVHRFVQLCWPPVWRWQKALEGLIYEESAVT